LRQIVFSLGGFLSRLSVELACDELGLVFVDYCTD